MNMNKKTKPQEMVAYDFSNFDLQENSKGNCFATECDSPCVCDCDCDGDPWPDYDPNHEIWQDK